jgi:hypothetical protein
MTLAAVDRLVHHSTIFEMNVRSYRRRTAIERKQVGAGRPASYATPKIVSLPKPSESAPSAYVGPPRQSNLVHDRRAATRFSSRLSRASHPD